MSHTDAQTLPSIRYNSNFTMSSTTKNMLMLTRSSAETRPTPVSRDNTLQLTRKKRLCLLSSNRQESKAIKRK